MRSSPVHVVDPTSLAEDERARLRRVAVDAGSTSILPLESLPSAVRAQFLFAIQAYSRGESVATIITGKPLTSTEAARLLGMSRIHLKQLCAKGQIRSFTVGNALRVPAGEVLRILCERTGAGQPAM